MTIPYWNSPQKASGAYNAAHPELWGGLQYMWAVDGGGIIRDFGPYGANAGLANGSRLTSGTERGLAIESTELGEERYEIPSGILGVTDSLDGSAGFTLACRVRIDTLNGVGSQEASIFQSGTSTSTGFWTHVDSDELRFRCETSGGFETAAKTGFSAAYLGEWITIFGTYEEGSDAEDLQLWINGVQEATVSVGGTVVQPVATTSIGASTSLPTRFTLDGGFAWLAIWDRVVGGRTGGGQARVSQRLHLDPSYHPLTRKRRFFSIKAPDVTAAITGTATASITEDDITTGGKTVIITLTGDTFVTGASSEDGIAGGSDSDKTGANKWDALVKTDLDNTDVVLSVGDTVATITLPAYASYDTDEQEVITWTIPAASLTTSASDITATPTFTVDAVSVGGPTAGSLSLMGVGI